MVDIPQHAAQIVALKSIIFNDPWSFKELFEIRPFTPYWLGYGTAIALNFIFDISTTIKIVVAGSQILFVWTAASFCQRMGMPAEWRWTFLILPFGFAYNWGFLNFIVAAPWGFVFLNLILKWRENPNKNNAIKIIGFVHFLFFAHLLVAGFFCFIAIFLLATPWKNTRTLIAYCFPVLSVIPITVIWIGIGLYTSPAASDPIIWMIGVNRIAEFLPQIASAPNDKTGYMVGLLFLAQPLVSGAKLRRSWVSWAPFIIYSLWMSIVPHYIGGNYFTYQRFGIFGLPLYYIGFQREDYKKQRKDFLVKSGIIFISASMILWQCIRVDIFNMEMKSYRATLQSTQPNGRMVMMAFDRMSKSNNEAPLMLHIAGWYQAEHHGLAEFNFARFWGLPLKYKNNKTPGIYPGFEWHPENFNWEEHDGIAIDYILLRHSNDASKWIEEKTSRNIFLIKKNDEWQLYGRINKTN